MLSALIGGAMIGLSASLCLLLFGRIAGISGIMGALVRREGDRSFTASFVAGLLVTGVILALLRPELFEASVLRSPVALVIAGLLAGFGARLGGGCTSGHGVCGISRLSVRSIAGTLTFMVTGAITVFVVQHLLGGSL